MAANNKPGVLRVDDILLGSIGAAIPHSLRVEHALRYLSTWSGSDKLMMAMQYGAKMGIPILQMRAQLQHKAGKRADPIEPYVDSIFKFAASVSMARRISGVWGILGILRQLGMLERSPPTSRVRLNLSRLQALSMLVFYPLEYISLFSNASAPLLRLPPQIVRFASLWSVRAWGIYTLIQVYLLFDETASLDVKEVRARMEKDTTVAEETIAAVQKRRGIINYQLFANISRLPVILHWSLVNGLYKNEFNSTWLSFISAIAALGGGWESSRIAPPTR